MREFAERMVTDHAGGNKAATELAARLKMKPESNATMRGAARAGGVTAAAQPTTHTLPYVCTLHPTIKGTLIVE